MIRSTLSRALTIAVIAGLAATATVAQNTGPQAVGQPSDLMPDQLRNVEVAQLLGAQVPMDLTLIDSTGEVVALADLIGERPVILVPVYYDCPMLCGMVLETLIKSLKTLQLEVGRDFDVVAFSFDPAETPDQAARARTRAVRDYDSASQGQGWHFLTGEASEVERLMEAVGFRAQQDAESGEFAHAAALFILTPNGLISRLFLGLSYPPRDLRLALVEAGNGATGNLVDQVLLYCFRYDPATARYSAAILKMVRAAGILTALGIAAFLFIGWRRERSRQQVVGGVV